MDLRNIKVSPQKLTLVLGGLALILMVFLIVRQLGALTEARDRVEEEKQALEVAELQLEGLLELQQRAPEFEGYLATLEKLIPSEAREDHLLIFLEEEALEAGTHLTRVGFEGYQSADDYMEISLRLSFEGEYNSFLKILGQMQQLQGDHRAFRIENIDLSRESLDMSVTTFYQDN